MIRSDDDRSESRRILWQFYSESIYLQKKVDSLWTQRGLDVDSHACSSEVSYTGFTLHQVIL